MNEDKNMADLVLIVPRGLLRDLFPWGVEVLFEFLKHNKPEINVHVWDLRNEEQIQMLLKEHRDCIKVTIQLLQKTSSYLGHQEKGGKGAYYSNVMLKFGSDLFSILQSEKVAFDIDFKKRHEKQLTELKQNFESILQSKARALLGGNKRAVFGISVYNGTLFESLYLASVLHGVQNESSIIVGGDDINIPTARTIIEHNNDIEGAVVGFGEEILLDLMQTFLNGTEIRDMQLDGLVNVKTISKYLSDPDIEQIAAQQASAIRNHMPAYVRANTKRNTIHILARRGCGWGRCTFCTNTIKKTFIDTNLATTKREIEKILDGLSVSEDADKPLWFKFSSDNNQIELMVNLLKWLSSQSQLRKMKFSTWFWMRVQEFSSDVAHELKDIKRNKNIKLGISVPIESLNPVSLRNMRKGITPLQGLKALKTLHDLGGTNSCWYFTFFPLDTLEGVSKEYYFMKNSLHLISAPQTTLWFNYYFGSTRDTISQNPKKYGIVIKSYNDIWLKKAFNIELPDSAGADYSLVPATSSEKKIVDSWYRVVRKLNWDITPKLKSKKLMKRFPALLWFVKVLSVLPEISRHITTQAVVSDFTYLKRNWIIVNLKWWTHKWRSGNGKGDNRFPQFFLKDSRLIKKYPFPFKESWSMELNPLELEVLRYLYGPRKFDDVIAMFKTKYSDKAINDILDKHLRLDSIVRHKSRLMSIFNDPGYLQTIKD